MSPDVRTFAVCGAIAALLGLCGGCATLTTGSSQTITVQTDPTGATCTLSRDGVMVGIVVDAASGATSECEPAVTIVLVPAVFPSVEARDQFFDRRRDEFKVESQKVKERIEKMCADTDCAKQLREAEVQEAAGLARIEEQRNTAQVDAAAKS